MLRGPGTRLLLAVALVLLSGGVSAEDAPELLLAEVTVNGGAPQTAFVLRDADDAFWIEAAMADEYRINGDRPPAIEHRGISFLPLAGFEDSEWVFDPARVALAVTLPPRYLHDQVRSLRRGNDAAPSRATGAFADYDLFYEEGSSDQSELFSALLEPTVFGSAGAFRNSVLYRSSSYDEPTDEFGFDLDRLEAGDGWIRLESTFVRDDPERLRSLRVGDVILAPGMLGTAARFGGVQLATNFGTRPNLVTFPLPQLAGEALLDSTVDLYVDGRRLTRESVAPGLFRFDEIPVSTGAGEIQMVSRDLTGREQVVTTDFYVSQRVLRRGLSEFSYGVGALRRDYGVDSNDYGDPLASGFHRYGYSDHLTIEGQGQVSSDVRRAAAGLSYTRARFGVASAGVGFSHADGAGTGYDLMLAHEFRTPRLRASSSVRYSSADYRQVSSYRDAARPALQYAVGGGYVLDRVGTVSATFVRRAYHDAASASFASASLAKSWRNGVSLIAYVSRYQGEDSDFTAGLSLTRFLGDRRSAGLDFVRRDEGTRLMAESSASLPRGPGLGYRFAAGRDDDEALWSASTSLQNRIGRYSFEADHDDDGTALRASAAGSAAWIGGMPFLTREVRDAFAVVRVNGFEGVNVFLDNQPMGQTDESGRILLPGLRPFEENRVRIEIDDLPLNARIDSTETIVTPYAGAGALADFPAGEGHDVMLRLLLPEGSPAPEGASVSLRGSETRFPVGLDGAVYLRGVSDGDRGVLQWEDRRCGFQLVIGGHEGLVPELGDVACGYEEGP
jgi:outer membrane usher protein